MRSYVINAYKLSEAYLFLLHQYPELQYFRQPKRVNFDLQDDNQAIAKLGLLCKTYEIPKNNGMVTAIVRRNGYMISNFIPDKDLDTNERYYIISPVIGQTELMSYKELIKFIKNSESDLTSSSIYNSQNVKICNVINNYRLSKNKPKRISDTHKLHGNHYRFVFTVNEGN